MALWEMLLTTFGLMALSALTRSLFFLSDRQWQLPDMVERGLRYAPLAAISAVIAPDIFMSQGHVNAHWHDARYFAAAAALLWALWRRDMLGTIIVGMGVYLPLHLGLGW